MDCLHYHLDKAIEILSKRPDVRLVPAERWHGEGFVHTSGYSSDCIVFDWVPDAETYQKVFALAKTFARSDKYGMGSDDLRRACFDLDVFGMRAGGAAKYGTYYEADEELSREED
jgi:hypothetical protein